MGNGKGVTSFDDNESGSETADSFWGRDLAASGGLLDAMFWQLGLPCFKWTGLKALPSVAPKESPEVFNATVRSLISVLDDNLAGNLPPLTAIHYMKTQAASNEEFWDGVMSSSEDEVFDISTVHEIGGGMKKKRGASCDPQDSNHGDHKKLQPDDTKENLEFEDMGVDTLPIELSEQINTLQDMALHEAHDESRQREYEELVEQMSQFEQFTNQNQTESEIDGRKSVEDTAAVTSSHDEQQVKKQEQTEEEEHHSSRDSVPVSPIAVAGLWELLQCVIGASFASPEASSEIASLQKERMDNVDTDYEFKRQGPPPNVRWYDARARAALQLVSKWLRIEERKFVTLELLLGSDRAPATIRPGRSKAVSDRYRYFKVGAAALGGGALFAVTGGLAAPAIAAGVGSVLGILPGAGAAAAAASVTGFMSTQAGVAALTTTIATAGAATTGSKMAYRTADVTDFGFYRLGDSTDGPREVEIASTSSSQESPAQEKSSTWQKWFSSKKQDEVPLSPIPSLKSPKMEGIKLSTIISVSGWVTDLEDYITPWKKSIYAPASDRYCLVWCRQELTALSSALGGLIAKGAAGQAARYGVQHLLAGGAGLVSALGPTVLLGAAAGMFIENAWTTAGERSDKAGKLLAHLLIEGGTGGRPAILIAHSMGSRAVMSCLVELSTMNARGLVQDVILMGTPLTPENEIWLQARRIVAGRFINCYSTTDWLLSVMFWQGVSKPAAGLTPVPVQGIENVNVSDLISGHSDYMDKMTQILSVLSIYHHSD